MSRKKIGEILVQNGELTQTELEAILKLQKNTGLRFGEALLKRGAVTEEALLRALSKQLDFEFREELKFEDPDGFFKQLKTSFFVKYKMVPFAVKKNKIYLAVNEPRNAPVDDIEIIFPDYEIHLVIATETEIYRVISENFEGEIKSDLAENHPDYDLFSTDILETENILEAANDAPIIKLVNRTISQAVDKKASDIHIEPYENELIIRYRVDGILYQIMTPPKKLQNAVISRIKIMANLNIAENRLPQDGRIQIKVGKKDIDIRVSVFPTYFGERIVLRLLNKSDMNFSIDSIGFIPQDLSLVKRILSKPNGIVLVTGPTGSGKTTTLYGMLTYLNSPKVNILTVEDPVEYQLGGVGQMQVKPKIDLTFASGLRSILRQDPDIIMVGEIRDGETAEIAVQAALTGHLVLSTLHTNDAASGVTRLIDMGIEPFLISSSVNAFLAQRLLRKICPHCKTSYKASAADKKILKTSKDLKLYHGKGCEKCLNIGYLGRSAIYEILPLDDELRRLIITKADASEIKSCAVRKGMKTLFQNGSERVLSGETTLEELVRVTGL
ncbi:MAG: type II secretion system ATPase GspE [Spirochaetes bacterium]|nr:type II secretion system ATPase GspE [Spirochaetota bacterium]